MPMERRTNAPAPSGCWTARKACRIRRGTVMLVDLILDESCGGITGRPWKSVVVCSLTEAVVDLLSMLENVVGKMISR